MSYFYPFQTFFQVRHIHLSRKAVLIAFLLAAQFALFGSNPETKEIVSTADSLLKVEDYKAARELWSRIVQSDGLSSDEALLYKSKLHYTAGLLDFQNSDYPAAATDFAEATHFVKDIDPKENADYAKDLCTSHYHALAYGGDWSAALRVCQEGFELFYAHLKGKAKADFIYDLGYLNDKNGNFVEAIRNYEASIEVLENLDEPYYFDIGLAYNNLSINYKAMGFFSARLDCLENARKHWESDALNIDPDYFITLYGNLLKVYLEYGDTESAALMLAKTDSTLESMSGSTAAQVITQHRLHLILHAANGELEAAERRLGEMHAYFKDLSMEDRKAQHHQLLACIQSLVDRQVELDKTESSEHHLRTGLEIANDFGNLYYQMSLNSEYSKLADLADRPVSEIIGYLDKALAINKKTEIGQENVMTLNLRKAQYFDASAKTDSARQCISRAFNALGGFEGNGPAELNISHFERHNSVYIIRALVNAAQLHASFHARHHDEDDLNTSFHLYKLAADVFQSYYEKGSYNPSLHQVNRDIKEGILSSLHHLGMPLEDELIDLMEQNNSQMLRKEFEARQQEYTSIPPALLNEKNLLIAQKSHLENSVEAYPDSVELVTQLNKLFEHIEGLMADINAIDPQFESFYATAPSVSETRDKLSKQDLIIHYIQGLERSFAVLVSKDEVGLVELGSRSQIDSLVTDFHLALQSPRVDCDALARACHNILIQPFEAQIQAHDNLIIVPDGKLNYLPFEVLRGGKNGDYLVTRHNISYSPSLSLWNLTSDAAAHNSVGQSMEIAAFSPVYSEAYYDGQTRNTAENRLEDIQGATREAKAIANSFSGDLYSGDDATKWKFIEQANRYDIFHLAMHTMYDDVQSQYSQLIFQNAEKLTFNELYALHLPAKLVVLSACNTGIGPLKAGEGMQSLSRALSYAGVQSSVYSLWPVPDAETEKIMLQFYTNLKSGFAKDKALAEAKRTFIAENPLRTHPYFWAGFVLQGDQSAVVEQEAGELYDFAIGFGIMLIFLFVWKRWRRLLQLRQ